MVTRSKVQYTLAVLLEGSLVTTHGWRYAIIAVLPGGGYPNRDGRQVRADQLAAVLYEWSPAGQVEVACRTVQAADGGVSADPAPRRRGVSSRYRPEVLPLPYADVVERSAASLTPQKQRPQSTELTQRAHHPQAFSGTVRFPA